jgi:group I intron endonuclease
MKVLNENEFNIQRQFGIYAIHCLANDELYVGSTKQSFRARLSNHTKFLKSNSLSNKKLQSDYNLYGEDNFQFEILKVCKNVENIEQEEQTFIENLKPYYNTAKRAVNRSTTNLNKKFTQEHRDKIREKSKLFKHKDLDKIAAQNKNGATKIKLTHVETGEQIIFNSVLLACDFLKINSLQRYYNRQVGLYLVEVLQTQKKSVSLLVNDEWITFSSFEKCDKFLNKWRGYTSTQSLRNVEMLANYSVKFN